MLNARVFAPPIARFVACALVFAAAIAVAASFAPGALACPAVDPQPLRVLYQSSDKIVTAHLGKTETVKVEKVNEGEEGEYAFTYLKTALLVSSTLKGEAEPVVYVQHIMYGDYKDALSSASDGDTLLVFLQKGGEEAEGSYIIEYMNYGLKTLPDAALKIYTRRIDELNTIMQAKEPSQAEIVEWLVRCTEEPATRWEGAYDLWTSHYALVEAQSRQADVADPDNNVAVESNPVEEATGEAAVNTDSIEETPESIHQYLYDNDGSFIQALTPEQKNRLVQALINIEDLASQDYVLIEVVKDWDDPRFIPYLLSQMRRSTENSAYSVEELMTTVAEKLGDKALIALAEEFRSQDYSSEFQTSDNIESSGDSTDKESGDAGAGEQGARDSSSTANDAAEQTRNAKLQYFIALAESIAARAPADVQLNASASEKP